ncbi:hypothetical protein MHIMP23_19505 [Methylobacterium hispanicum]
MGRRKPLDDEGIGRLAGKIATAILNEVEDARTSEVLDRWDELKGVMPLAFDIVLATREALLDAGYGRP